MKKSQAICLNGEWFAHVTYLETGETYKLRCRDEEHAETVALREIS